MQYDSYITSHQKKLLCAIVTVIPDVNTNALLQITDGLQSIGVQIALTSGKGSEFQQDANRTGITVGRM
jgi:hypothetical protein